MDKIWKKAFSFAVEFLIFSINHHSGNISFLLQEFCY